MENLYKKLFEIQSLKLVFEKTKENPFTKSKYCPLPEVWKKLEPILTEKQLLCIHEVKDGVLKTSVIDMENYKDPREGSCITDRLSTELHINSVEAQRMGSDITYFKRYNLGCIFNIITDDDTDGNKGGKGKGEAKIFDVKKLEAMKKWAVGKKNPEIMQYILKIKKDYELSTEMKEEMDLYLKQIS